VVEKRDEPNPPPRVGRNVSHPREVVSIEDLAQVLQHQKQRENGQASDERHDWGKTKQKGCGASMMERRGSSTFVAALRLFRMRDTWTED
jgi:hypothetical protein